MQKIIFHHLVRLDGPSFSFFSSATLSFIDESTRTFVHQVPSEFTGTGKFTTAPMSTLGTVPCSTIDQPDTWNWSYANNNVNSINSRDRKRFPRLTSQRRQTRTALEEPYTETDGPLYICLSNNKIHHSLMRPSSQNPTAKIVLILALIL